MEAKEERFSKAGNTKAQTRMMAKIARAKKMRDEAEVLVFIVDYPFKEAIFNLVVVCYN